VKKFALIVLAVALWAVLLVVQLVTGAREPVDSSDVITQLFSGPSAWFVPVRSALLAASQTLPDVGGQLLPGLAIGDVSRVSESLNDAMKSSSLTHLVAVSGANCQVVTAAAFGLLAWVGAPRWLRILGAAMALLCFVALVTPGPSITRAAVMALAVLMGLALGRLSGGLPALAIAVILLLIVHPMWATNFGFILSVCATAGLLTLTEPLARILSRWVSRWLALVIAVPLSASVLCQPVIILLSPYLPTYGILANILAVPAAAVVTVLGIIACVAAVVMPPIGVLICWIAWLPAEWIGRVALTLSEFPFARLPWPTGIAGLVTAVAVSGATILIAISRHTRVKVVSIAVIVVALGSSAAWALGGAQHRIAVVPPHWQIAACDVGQGDAVLIRSQGVDGRTHIALIDTGRAPTALRDCLVRLGISHLDLLVLTHYDLDHIGGASAVFGKVDHVIKGVPENVDDERLHRALCSPPTTCEVGRAGMRGRLGAFDWHVLWPDGRTPGMQAGNPGSITVLMRSPELSAIFLGDLGAAAQEALADTYPGLASVDVVKVAHHGSADTSGRLTSVLRPRIGLISVGVDNGYGHPTGKAMDALQSVGAVIGRTDRHGMLFVSVSEKHLQLDTDR
jgi:competence protein ComEC